MGDVSAEGIGEEVVGVGGVSELGGMLAMFIVRGRSGRRGVGEVTMVDGSGVVVSGRGVWDIWGGREYFNCSRYIFLDRAMAE